jgi:hypothetical protein
MHSVAELPALLSVRIGLAVTAGLLHRREDGGNNLAGIVTDYKPPLCSTREILMSLGNFHGCVPFQKENICTL